MPQSSLLHDARKTSLGWAEVQTRQHLLHYIHIYRFSIPLRQLQRTPTQYVLFRGDLYPTQRFTEGPFPCGSLDLTSPRASSEGEPRDSFVQHRCADDSLSHGEIE